MPSQLNGKRAPGDRTIGPAQTALPPQRYGGRRGLRGLVSVGAHTTEGASLREGRRGRSASPDTGQQAGRASCSAHVACDRGEAVACLLRDLHHDLPSRGAAPFAATPWAHRARPSSRSSRLARFAARRRRRRQRARAGGHHRARASREAIGRSTADIVVIDADTIRNTSADSVEDLIRRVAGMQVVAQRRARARARASSSAARARTARSCSSTAFASARRRSARPSSRRSAWRRSSASRSCADRRRACTAPMRSAASSRSSRAAAKARRGRTRRPRSAATTRVAATPARAARSAPGTTRSRSATRRAAASRRSRPAISSASSIPTHDGFKRDSGTVRLGFTPAPGHRIGVHLLETRLNAQYDGTEPPVLRRPVARLPQSPDHARRLARLPRQADQRVDDDAAGLARGRRPDERRQRSRAASSPGASRRRGRTRSRSTPGSSWCSPTSTSRSAPAPTPSRATSRAATTPACSATRARFGAAHAAGRRCATTTTRSTAATRPAASATRIDARRRREAARARRDDLSRADLQRPRLSPASACRRSSRSAAAASRSARAGKARRATLSATVYRNDVHDLIVFEPDRSFCPPDPAYDFGCAANTARARLQGATLTATGTLAQLDLRANVDLLDATDADTGERLPRRAAHQESAGADYVAGAWRFGAVGAVRRLASRRAASSSAATRVLRPARRLAAARRSGSSRRGSPTRSIAPSSRCATTAASAARPGSAFATHRPGFERARRSRPSERDRERAMIRA